MTETEGPLKKSGEAADESFSSAEPDQPAAACGEKTWVDIELVDAEGNPIPFEEFRLTLPDGRVIIGELDENGLAGLDGIRPGEGKLEFPNLHQDGAEIQE